MLHAVAVAHGDGIAVRRIFLAQSIEVDGDAERRADLILATVAPPDGAAFVIEHVVLELELGLVPGSAVTFAAADAVTGASNGNCAAAESGSELASNGFARAAATITDISGNSGTPTASSKDVITFTDNTAATTVQDSCLVNQSSVSNANNVILAAASFTAITLQIGDTIQITWTVAWTWS